MDKEVTQMTNYWLVVTTRENFNAIAEREFDVDGFRENCLKRVKAIEKEDNFICYIKKDYAFGVIYQAVSKYDPNDKDKRLEGFIFADEKREGKKLYPLRFRTKPILIPRDKKMLDAINVIKNLPSVKNKQDWRYYVHHSLRNISQEDFERIQSKMKKSGFFKEVKPQE